MPEYGGGSEMSGEYRIASYNLGGEEPGAAQWDNIESIQLVDVITGKPPLLNTSVKMLTDSDTRAWWILFTGLDNGVVTKDEYKHDDPIYDCDVLELFYCDTGSLYEYKELEVSPKNVTFDASITYRKPFDFTGDTSWELEGWKTRASYDSASIQSLWKIPLDSLGIAYMPGLVLPANLFRIDRGADSGHDEYTAWQPTGVLSFHLPDKFGRLIFM